MGTTAKKQHSRSQRAFERGRQLLVGGVNSPVRAFGAVGGTPLVVDRAQGAQIWDVDGNAYLDFVCSWGALILGHANPEVSAAIADQAKRGTSYGMTTELEIELAEMLHRALPSLERVRFVTSGTEATMSAVRLARAARGRTHALGGIGALREFGYRSDHERRAAGARGHAQGFHREV